MKQVSCTLTYWSAALFTLALLPVSAYGMGIELEPDDPTQVNDPCPLAQDMGSYPEGVYGDLDVQDVDFFRFYRTPGDAVMVTLEGTSEGSPWPGRPPLADPYLGLFDTNCNLIAADDNAGGGLNSQLLFAVPAEGEFVLAATAYFDVNFDGSHEDSGTYTLTIANAPAASSISGRVVDAFSGDPVAGAYADLLRCWDSSCTIYDYVNSQMTDALGEFLFEWTYSGDPLLPGFYKVSAWASNYLSGSSEVFELLEGQHLSIGDIELLGPPVRFSDVDPCEYVPVIGGECEYTVRITNTEPETLRGAAWSLVTASGTGSWVGYTEFQAGGLERIVLPPGGSTEVEFEFDVPGTVPQGAYICPGVWVGLGLTEPYFFTLGQMQPLFCVYKGMADSYTLITGAEAKAILRQINLQQQQHRKLPTKAAR